MGAMSTPFLLGSKAEVDVSARPKRVITQTARTAVIGVAVSTLPGPSCSGGSAIRCAASSATPETILPGFFSVEPVLGGARTAAIIRRGGLGASPGSPTVPSSVGRARCSSGANGGAPTTAVIRSSFVIRAFVGTE